MTTEIKYEGKITARKEVLNLISILAFEASSSYRSRGRESLAEQAAEIGEAIYTALEKSGYYED